MAKRAAAKTTRKPSRASKNGKTLVIVESPAKAKTINKYLGDDYVVKASMGHVRDLPEHDFGVDLDHEFQPTYQIVRGRTKVINELRKLAAKAPQVVLATDRDREGEAIAWHLVEALELPDEKVRRVIFNEITKSAIKTAFEHPHHLDMDRVNAQQARRILDRIVGYELSPLLWKKIARGLSAGRVQSVAVRLIVEREREIRAFVPEESWKVVAYVCGDVEAAESLRPQWEAFAGEQRTQKDIQRWLSEHGAFRAELAQFAGRPFKPGNVEEALTAIEALGFEVRDIHRRKWDEYPHLDLELVTIEGALRRSADLPLKIGDLQTKRTTTRPPAPFTTASLQQAASTRLGFSASRTMRVAQSLYEGVDLHGEGPVGLITYMRTDSTNLSGEALGLVRDLIAREFGEQYLPQKPNFYGKRQARAQEAHEAIRPTDPNRTPESLRGTLSNEQLRLYELIWKRFVACQMPPAQWDATSVTITCETEAGTAKFNAGGRKLVFDGFMKVAGVTSDDQLLPPLEVGQPVGALGLDPRQQFTSPPPRYTEASLVKALESLGIGRPSTYAAIIDTIQSRGYVEQEDRKFHPSALGEVVTDKLIAHFPKLMDVKFTSYMEDELDKIEEAHLDWVHVLHEFYDPFRELLARAGEKMEEARAQPSEYKCPLCDAPMVYRWSRNGRFLSCTAYPDCKGTLNVNRDGEPLRPKDGAHLCELCGKPMAVKHSRRGHFLGCTGYPECRNTVPCDEEGVPLKVIPEEEYTKPCDQCGKGTMVVKWKRLTAFLGCNRYPDCKATEKIPPDIHIKKKPAPPPEEAGVACEKCNRPMVIRDGRRGKFIACSGYPKCRNAKPIEKLEELRAEVAKNGTKVPTLAEAAEAEAQRNGAGKAPRGKVNLEELGEPPPGYAWTRTGRPVVETMPDEGALKCPECGGVMELKRGRFGPFFSCSRFPKCRFNCNLRGQAKKDAEELMPAPARPKPIPTDIPCEECGKPMMVREGRNGKFLGCSGYPQCRATQELPPGFVIPPPTDEKVKAGA
ncbi:MAG: type I DNA topoisomerase [Planctomycetota bacterium]|nr:MAG: type I DNA topoisomerase [Planctomycetota bacterium]